MNSDEHVPSAPALPPEHSTTFTFDGRQHVLIELTGLDELPLSELSEAERTILRGLLSGHSAQGIADDRQTSARTVQGQVETLYSKLKVSSRSELLRRLRNAGEVGATTSAK
jgi:DNA-binding NarL/FixJ family response regulator